MRTSEVLLKAANLIEARGWVQGPGGWTNWEGGGLCLEGGILAAMGGPELNYAEDEFIFCPAYNAVRDYLVDGFSFASSRRHSDGVAMLWDWNDEESRTEAEVLEVLRAVALLEAGKESVGEFTYPTTEAHILAVAARFGLTPFLVDDRMYLARPLPGLSEALVYSARVEVDAR